MPFVLATDALVWLLVAATIAYAVYCRRHAHLAAPWRRVFQSPAAMASVVVLAAFVAVGLVDSLHFRPQLPQKEGEPKAYATEVLSVLDVGLAHLRGRGEKTYSAPLATRSYAKEQVELPDHSTHRTCSSQLLPAEKSNALEQQHWMSIANTSRKMEPSLVVSRW